MKNLNYFLQTVTPQTPFNDSDHPVNINSKYHGTDDFNKLNINKYLSFATLHLNIILLCKPFEDFTKSNEIKCSKCNYIQSQKIKKRISQLFSESFKKY